jgi:hypothetical protein
LRLTRQEVVADVSSRQGLLVRAGLDDGNLSPGASGGLGHVHHGRPIVQQLLRLALLRVEEETYLCYAQH